MMAGVARVCGEEIDELLNGSIGTVLSGGHYSANSEYFERGNAWLD
jgi:hypothetical protein